jgi:hypothetical protein
VSRHSCQGRRLWPPALLTFSRPSEGNSQGQKIDLGLTNSLLAFDVGKMAGTFLRTLLKVAMVKLSGLGARNLQFLALALQHRRATFLNTSNLDYCTNKTVCISPKGLNRSILQFLSGVSVSTIVDFFTTSMRVDVILSYGSDIYRILKTKHQ